MVGVYKSITLEAVLNSSHQTAWSFISGELYNNFETGNVERIAILRLFLSWLASCSGQRKKNKHKKRVI